MDINKIRADFPILETQVYGRQLVYLDSAATAQKPRCVIDKVAELYETSNANIHRGVHFLAERATEMYENARNVVQKFIGATHREEIVFTSGATASLNLVAYSYGEMAFHEGDNIIVSEMEHHSNIVPWQIVCERKGVVIRVLPFNDRGELEVDKLSELLDERTRLVAVTHASNVLGTMPDVRKICDLAHAVGAIVVVDGCQGVVHGGVDVGAFECDFYAFSGHKLYAPTGIGVLYGKRELLEKMPPFMGGGDMIASVSFDKTTYAELPLKFEAGTANYIDAIALSEAINYIIGLGLETINRHEQRLLTLATEKLSEIEGVKIYGRTDNKCAIISFNIDGVHNYDLGMILDKQGIAVRTGTHCAEPIMSHYGVRGMCRASFALYNSEEEVAMLVEGVKRALKMLR